MEIDTSHYLEAIKLLRDLLGGLCVGMVCIGGWIIYVTRWKASVDIDLKALKDKNPVSEKDCIASHENCEKHISSEFGHGSARFKRLEDKIDAKDIEDEARYQGLLASMEKILLKMAER